MMFWDSSAIIPLCVDEPRSKEVRNIVKKDSSLVIWWGTPVECFSAFARLRRENSLTGDDENYLINIIHLLSDSWTEISPSRDVRDIAARLLRIHPLRDADSLQLAASLIWAGRNPAGQSFVCFDKRLRDAAAKEGFTCLP